MAVTKERFRPRRVNLLNYKLFAKFKDRYPEHRDRDYPEFEKVIKLFSDTFIREVVNNRDGVDMPDHLGLIFIGACWAPKKKNVDFVATKKAGKTVLYTNIETDGKLAKVFYTNYQSRYIFQYRELWGFESSRELSREASKGFRKDWKKYIAVDPNYRINRIYKVKNRSLRRKKMVELTEHNYNEFDFD